MLIQIDIQDYKVTFSTCMESSPYSYATASSLHSGQYAGFMVKFFNSSANSDASIMAVHLISGLVTKYDMAPMLWSQIVVNPGPL